MSALIEEDDSTITGWDSELSELTSSDQVSAESEPEDELTDPRASEVCVGSPINHNTLTM